jgi:hypothetical protein
MMNDNTCFETPMLAAVFVIPGTVEVLRAGWMRSAERRS